MLAVLAEGDGFVAVAKPAGRIVVPGRGDSARDVTVRQELERQLGRALLVVHRLDRGTSGVLVFATDAPAHRALSLAFERHTVVKRYLALVRGALFGSGEIELPLVSVRGGLVRIGRAGEPGGKPSRTGWRALERLAGFTLLELRPRSGRLHQIRAHVQAIGHPLAVDPAYGGATRLTRHELRSLRGGASRASGPAASAEDGVDAADSRAASRSDGGRDGRGDGDEVVLARSSLHASSIKFPDPRGGSPVIVEAPLPPDLALALELLRALPPRQ